MLRLDLFRSRANDRRVVNVFRSLALGAASVAAMASVGCATRPCTRAVACGVATWVATGTGAVTIEGMMARALALETGGGGMSPLARRSERLPVGGQPVLIRFDALELKGRTQIEKAVLALTPSDAWTPTGRRTQLFAHAVVGAWTPENANELPLLSSEPTGEVTLSGEVRTPVRIDVTAAVRAWSSGQIANDGIALVAYGDPLVFNGAGADVLLRPRLEVVAR